MVCRYFQDLGSFRNSWSSPDNPFWHGFFEFLFFKKSHGEFGIIGKYSPSIKDLERVRRSLSVQFSEFSRTSELV